MTNCKEHKLSQIDKQILLIGYGNTLRRDDGVGIFTLESLPSDVYADYLIQQELGLELIEIVSSYKLVIFIDASIEENIPDIYLQELSGEQGSMGFSHTLNPPTIINLANQLYGGQVKGYILSIKGYDFDLGEGLSEPTEKLMQEARQIILELIKKHQHA